MKNAFNNNQNDEKDFRKLKIYEIALIKKKLFSLFNPIDGVSKEQFFYELMISQAQSR